MDKNKPIWVKFEEFDVWEEISYDKWLSAELNAGITFSAFWESTQINPFTE